LVTEPLAGVEGVGGTDRSSRRDGVTSGSHKALSEKAEGAGKLPCTGKKKRAQSFPEARSRGRKKGGCTQGREKGELGRGGKNKCVRQNGKSKKGDVGDRRQLCKKKRVSMTLPAVPLREWGAGGTRCGHHRMPI